MEEVRTILAGGSPLLQAGMMAALAQDPRVKLVAQARDAQEGATRARELPCDVLILNAEVPRLEAALVMEHLTNGAGRTKLLVLTENESRDEMLATLRLGVHGYGIRSTLWPEDLCVAVLALARGDSWACRLTTRYLMATAVEHTVAIPLKLSRHNSLLSERELEVLRLAANGAGEEHIAQTLYLSRNTVKTYLRRIRDKLQAGSRAEAIRLAIQRGLLPEHHLVQIEIGSRAEPVGLAG